MNWTRGLLRLWMIIAACWIIVTTWLQWNLITNPFTKYVEPSPFIDITMFIFLPPLVLLLLGLSGVWVMRGFRRSGIQGGSP